MCSFEQLFYRKKPWVPLDRAVSVVPKISGLIPTIRTIEKIYESISRFDF